MFVIQNDGQAIRRTSYWGSEHERAGFAYLSWNAGAARLLLPSSHARSLPDMRTATMVIVSTGPWMDRDGRDAVEIIFDDGSEAPFCMTFGAEQTDRSLPASDQGGGFVFAVWTNSGKQLERPGKHRRVASIPDMSPWVEH